MERMDEDEKPLDVPKMIEVPVLELGREYSLDYFLHLTMADFAALMTRLNVSATGDYDTPDTVDITYSIHKETIGIKWTWCCGHTIELEEKFDKIDIKAMITNAHLAGCRVCGGNS